jgi:hypothetical protein
VNHTRTATAVSLAFTGLLLTGCSSQPKADGRAATACMGKTWPQQLPAVVGKPLTDAVSGPLLCFNITEAASPDGHKALNDSTTQAADWTITGITPAAGTSVTEKQAITLTVDNQHG